MSLYVAAYDVSDDRRRNRVSRVLTEYGHRVQLSVFVGGTTARKPRDRHPWVSAARLRMRRTAHRATPVSHEE